MGQWQRGISGNPRGRPRKGRTLTEALEKYADDREAAGDPARERLACTIWTMALDGDLNATKLLFERVEGRAVQPIAGVDDDDSPPIPLIIMRPEPTV